MQKQGIIKHVDRVMDSYKKGEITNAQLAKIIENLQKSPIFAMSIVNMADAHYVQSSGLAAEEKQRAKLDFQRFARGYC